MNPPANRRQRDGCRCRRRQFRDRVERERQIARGLEPRVRILFEAPPHDAVERNRDVCGCSVKRRDVVVQDCVQGLTRDSRSNARRPVNSSNSIAPSANRSARSSVGSPRICSGAM